MPIYSIHVHVGAKCTRICRICPAHAALLTTTSLFFAELVDTTPLLHDECLESAVLEAVSVGLSSMKSAS